MKICYGSSVGKCMNEINNKETARAIYKILKPHCDKLSLYKRCISSLVSLNLPLNIFLDEISADTSIDSISIDSDIQKLFKKLKKSHKDKNSYDVYSILEEIRDIIPKSKNIKLITKILSESYRYIKFYKIIKCDDNNLYMINKHFKMPTKKRVIVKKKFTIYSSNVRREFVSHRPQDSIDYKGSYRSMFVNVIHSLDAQINIHVINSTNHSIATIHDC
jgi:hypothetical protein